MKKIYFLVVAMFFTCTMAMAQSDNNGGERRQMDPSKMAERRTEQMVKQYSLNDTQKAALLKLNQDFMTSMASQRMGKPGNNDGQQPDETTMQKMREEMQKARADYNTKLKGILTEDQYNQYVKNEQNRRHGGPGQGRPDANNN